MLSDAELYTTAPLLNVLKMVNRAFFLAPHEFPATARIRRSLHLCSMYFICSFQFRLESKARPKNFALPSTFTGWLFTVNVKISSMR